MDKNVIGSSNGATELTAEEARVKREQFLALAEQSTTTCESDADDIDSADSSMATLILPGG